MEYKEKLERCFSLMDITTLKSEDTPSSVRAFVEKINALSTHYPSCPLPAAICVYPNFASVVRETLRVPVKVAAVAGAFPSSQSFLEVKCLESRMAVENGADEVDIVLALNAFLEGDEERASQEIRAIRQAVGESCHLKVILETGVLADEEKIYRASMLAMESGADFIKTSTGKVPVNATPEAARVMCRAIADYYARTGKKVGFKAAGGISTAEEALQYMQIVEEILGSQWLTPALLRLGVSRLGNSLLSAMMGEKVNYF